MPKVLISDKMSSLATQIFKERDLQVDVKTSMSNEELISCIAHYDGLAVRSLTKVTEGVIAAGENLHTLAEFTSLISAGGVDFPEPDLTTCGGITIFMKVAHLAEAHGLPVTSHGAHDIHVHLLAAAPNAAYLEVHGFGLEKYMAHSLEMRDGMAIAPERPGHGIEFD